MYLSVKEIAKRYAVSRATIWRWVSDGRVLPRFHGRLLNG